MFTEKRWKIQPLVFRALDVLCVASASRWNNSNWKFTPLRVTLVVTVCVFDCIFSDIHAHTRTQKMCAQNEYKGAFSHTVYSLYTSVTLCAVTLILELKMHAKNRNTYMYTRTNFQKHLHRGREDVQSCWNERAQNARIFPLFLIFVETDDKTQKAAKEYSTRLCLLSKAAFKRIRAVGRTLLLSRSFS